MIFEYIQKAIKRAQYKMLDNGTWFAEIPGFEGVQANAKTVEECRHELIEVLEEWLVLKISDRDPIPIIEGVEIDKLVKSPKTVTPAEAGVQTLSLRKQGTILKTGFLFSQETLDSCFRRNDQEWRFPTFYETIKIKFNEVVAA